MDGATHSDRIERSYVDVCVGAGAALSSALWQADETVAGTTKFVKNKIGNRKT